MSDTIPTELAVGDLVLFNRNRRCVITELSPSGITALVQDLDRAWGNGDPIITKASLSGLVYLGFWGIPS